MMLFDKDRYYYPNGIYDYKTKNTSFLKLVSLYKTMKVNNKNFILFLSQPELQGVDPHSDNLTIEQKAMIAIECKTNIWYFLREVVRIAPTAGDGKIPYKASRGNIALTWTFLNGMDMALIQPRQTGKSVSTDCIMLWLLFFVMKNSIINLITKDNDLREKNIIRLKKMRSLLPPYLNFHQKGVDSDNLTEITCKALENIYNTNVAQKDERSANNLGRGLTTPITHIDEGPFISYISVTLPAALASGGAAREEARANGLPNGNIFTTTAGKKDDRDGRYMYEMISGGAQWSESYYDLADRATFFKVIDKICVGKKMLINGTFSHRQLGYDDKWLYEKMRENNARGEEADRDFLNIWTAGTQRSPLHTSINEALRKHEIDPVYSEITREGYVIRWYIDELEIRRRQDTTKFIVGMDTSDAIGRDAIGMVIVDISDLSVVGCMTCNQSNLLEFANTVTNFMIKYKNAILIPERKSSAQTFIDALWLMLPQYGIDPFKRIFNTLVDNYAVNVKEYQELQSVELTRRTREFYETRKGKFGFITDGPRRNLLYSIVLTTAAEKTAALVRDKMLVGELTGLVEKNGRIDHGMSGHDDHVIAWLLCHWLVMEGKNLEYYGINRDMIERVKYKGSQKLDAVQLYALEEQKALKIEIAEMAELITKSKDPHAVTYYRNKITFLKTKLTDDTLDTTSLDKLSGEIDEVNSLRRKLASSNLGDNYMDKIRGNNFGDIKQNNYGDGIYSSRNRFTGSMDNSSYRSSIRGSQIDFC